MAGGELSSLVQPAAREKRTPFLKPRRGENRPERDLAIYVICHLGVFTHQEIGRQFGVGCTSISGALKRVEGYVGSDTELKKGSTGF